MWLQFLVVHGAQRKILRDFDIRANEWVDVIKYPFRRMIRRI